MRPRWTTRNTATEAELSHRKHNFARGLTPNPMSGSKRLWSSIQYVATFADGIDNSSDLIWVKEGTEMLGYFINAFFAVRGAHDALLQRARTERGASMVEYALLVGLIAVVAVVAIAALGGGISNLFKNANSCVGGLNSTSC